MFFSIVLAFGVGTSSYYTLTLIHESVITNDLSEMRTLSTERGLQIKNLHKILTI